MKISSVNILYNKNNMYFCAGKKVALYAGKIGDNKEPVRFESLTDAQNNLNIDKSLISGVLCGKRNTTKGYFFIDAKNIEDKNGNIDKSKLDYFTNAIANHRTMLGIYALKVGSNAAPVKFSSAHEAQKELGINLSDIYHGANRYSKIVDNPLLSRDEIRNYLVCEHQSNHHTKIAKGYIFAYSNKIEDENSAVISEKMGNLLKIAAYYNRFKTIYAKNINSLEDLMVFNDVKEASEALKIHPRTIYYNLNNNSKPAKGSYIFRYAIDIEDEYGNVDENKMAKFLQYCYQKSEMQNENAGY